MGNGTDDEKAALELYKLEYEKGAERYQEIYKSVWANFNYLVLLAGGILAFSSNFKVLPTWLTPILAVLPLLYWYLAVFKPGNRYGDQVVARLSRVEKILNKKYAGQFAIPLSSPPDPISSPPDITEDDYGLRHFTLYHERRRSPASLRAEQREARWPAVRVTTFWAALLILAGALVGAGFSIFGSKNEGKVITVDQHPKSLEVKVGGADAEQVQKELENLKALVSEMSVQLKRIEEKQRQPLPLQSPSTTQDNGNVNH